MQNPIGLRIIFEGDGERAWANFTASGEHQGYPGVSHGGIIFARLDIPTKIPVDFGVPAA